MFHLLQKIGSSLFFDKVLYGKLWKIEESSFICLNMWKIF